MTQYIDKDALVVELKKRVSDYWSNSDNTMGIYPYALEEVIKYIDTLEVKEVDLEKEIKEEYLKHRCYGGKDNMLVILNEPQFNKIAKHFYELGQAQKGE